MSIETDALARDKAAFDDQRDAVTAILGLDLIPWPQDESTA